MKNFKYTIILMMAFPFLNGCIQPNEKKDTLKTDENGFVILSDAQIENIVKRSYQYVAMFNVNNKFALKQGGWNSFQSDTKLKDHTMKEIARPNNVSFFSTAMLKRRTHYS
jgi:hypothetical protein